MEKCCTSAILDETLVHIYNVPAKIAMLTIDVFCYNYPSVVCNMFTLKFFSFFRLWCLVLLGDSQTQHSILTLKPSQTTISFVSANHFIAQQHIHEIKLKNILFSCSYMQISCIQLAGGWLCLGMRRGLNCFQIYSLEKMELAAFL